MSQTLSLDVRGLWTNASNISGTPKGSMSVAMNVDLSKTNILQSRRGYDELTYALPNGSDRITKFFDYSQRVFATYNNNLGLYDEFTGWSSKGALTKPVNALVSRGVSIKQNFYLTSNAGLKKLDSVSGQLYQAGITPGLNIELALTGALGTAIVNAKSVAYRYVLVRTDANNILVLGGVSSRAVITNTAGADRDVTVKCYLPSSIDNTYALQIYRTANFTGDPDDNEQLCYQQNLTNANITAGFFTFTDIYPDSLLGATIYTGPSVGQGISQNNEEPPLASDICEYKNCLIFADTVSKHLYSLTLISVDGTGLALNDTITISNGVVTEVYTAKAATTVANKEFAIDTASVSLSVRIDNTIRQLITVINQASAIVAAQLLATRASDLPGKISLQARTLGAPAFTVVSSKATPWSPQLQPTASVSQTSKNDAIRNRIMWSKSGLPEAVPLGNFIDVGRSDDPIKRIVPLRDGVLIFKGIDGVWILRGEDPLNFSVSLLDGTEKITAPESLGVINGKCIGLFENGIGEVTDTQVSIISDQIFDKIQRLYGICYPEIVSYCFSITNEINGKYTLALPQNSGDTYSTYQLVYNIFNELYEESDIAMTAGIVSSVDKKQYLGSGLNNKVKRERKTFTDKDFADFGQVVNLTDATGMTLTLPGTEFMSVGDSLSQSGVIVTIPAYITAVNAIAGQVTVDIDQTWNIGDPITHNKGIKIVATWNDEFGGNPAGLKTYSEVNILLKQAIVQRATISFSSDIIPTVQVVPIEGASSSGAWGYSAWGDGAWGGDTVPQPVRKGIPRPSSSCNSLVVSFATSVAFSDFQLTGLSLIWTPSSTRTTR